MRSALHSLLQICAYATRARSRLGRRGREARRASRHRSEFYKDIWTEAARELDATLECVAHDIYRIRRGNVGTRVHNNETPLDDPVSCRLADDKSLVHATLRSHGLPTPSHLEYGWNAMGEARAFLARNRRCVVKPAAGTGAGRGVTTGVESRRQLLLATVRAAGYGSRVLVERQMEGEVLRLLYLDGQLLDAVKRSPPSIVGDGSSRVSLLVGRLNEARLDAGYQLAQALLDHDLDMRRTLAGQGLSWRSIPPKGRRVVLKGVVNDNMADENESIADDVSESIVDVGRRAAEAVGVRLAGVDIITPDYRQALDATGGVVLEVNAAPGYHYHYCTRTGRRRVAVPILRACLAAATSPLTPAP